MITEQYVFNYFGAILSMIFAANTVLLYFATRDLRLPVYRYFASYVMLTSIYLAMAAMQTFAVTLELKEFWANIKVSAMCFKPMMWMWFTMLLTVKRIPPRWINAVLIVVALSNIIVLYNDDSWHLFRVSNELVQVSDNFSLMSPKFGIWFNTVYVLSIYIPAIFSMICIIYALFLSKNRLRAQYIFQLLSIIVLIMSGLPVVTSLTFLDTYALGIVILLFLHYILIHKFSFLDVVPLANLTVLENIDSGVFVYNGKKMLVELNPAGEVMKRYFPADTLDSLTAFVGDGKQCLLDGSPVSFRIKNDEHEEHFSVKFYELKDKRGNTEGYLAFISNITQQHMLMKIESEKDRLEQKKIIIGDIHDGVSGSITIIGMLAGQIFSNEDEMRRTLKSIEEISAETAKEIRLMMGAYDRENPDMLRLSGDIRYIGNLYTSSTPIAFTHTEYISGYESVIIPFNRYIKLIHFTKECITNSVKHSCAGRIESSISVNGEKIIMTVKDDGKGLSEKQDGSGYGLRNMQSRIESIGGSLIFAANGGTVITAEIPLN